MTKPKIAVIGAGLMGHGIAQVFALAGHDVTITDSHKPTLDTRQGSASPPNLRDLGDDERAVERVRPVADLADCVREADFVVEAVLEDMPLKQKNLRRDREARAARHHPRQQHLGDADHRDHAGPAAPRRARSARTGGIRRSWCRWSR